MPRQPADHLSEEGEAALAIYVKRQVDQWIARYGEESMQARAGTLIPLWIDQALSVFSEADLIRLAQSDSEQSDNPADAPAGGFADLEKE